MPAAVAPIVTETLTVAPPLASQCVDWQITSERQRHEWLRTRRMIIAARLRIVVYGHIVFLLLMSALNALGMLAAGSQFSTAGWLSLCFASAALLAMEFVHMRMLPKVPPRFVVRHNGVTEYDDQGPRAHWDWSRTSCLRLEQDRERPEFQSLVFVMDGPQWLWRLNHFYIPLPENSGGETDPRRVIAAIAAALESNNIALKGQHDGTMALVHEKHGAGISGCACHTADAAFALPSTRARLAGTSSRL